MRNAFWAGLLLALLVAALPAPGAVDEGLVYVTATVCKGSLGVYRWPVKTDHELPPEVVKNKVKPSEMGNWAPLGGVINKKTPRSGREKEWFEVRGKVTLVKAEDDGDLVIQLADEDGSSNVNVVVEVPVRQDDDESPWDAIREMVFHEWTKTKFPFTLKKDESKKLTLMKSPVVRVVGKAFFDAEHATKDATGKCTNRRKDEAGGKDLAVWEIHPVIVLEEIKAP
jgi:hypothetical protein